jgi:hypothetical protein
LADTITESFCERCGTRYEFSAPTRLNPLRKTRGLFGGLKNYLTSQDALSDAMNDAMRFEEGALASAQLEAFHESFNFCIDCRQYTCVNCWNDDAGRCRTCAPVAGTDDLGDRLAATLADGGAAAMADPLMAQDDLQRRLGLDAWPVSDLPASELNGHAPVPEGWPVAEPLTAGVAPVEPVEGVLAPDGFVYDTPRIEVEPEPEPIVAEVAPEPEPEPVVAEAPSAPEPDWESVAAELAVEQAAQQPLQVLAWDADAAYEVEAEPMVAEVAPEVAPEPEPEPMVAEVAPEPEPEPVVAEVAPEPEPVVAEVPAEPEPEPIFRHTIAPVSETILRFPQRPAAPEPAATPLAAEDESPELAARRAQLDMLGLGDPGEGPVHAEPQVILPYRSRGAAIPHGELAARAAAQGATFWEASAREVAGAVANVGIQACGGCGLSLSANARFCRRCGSPQSRSA